MEERKDENEIIKKRQAEAGAFQKKYGSLLRNLSSMPKSTKEEREARWSWFSARPVKDDFILDALRAYSDETYRAMLYKFTDAGADGNYQAKKKKRPSGADDGIAYYTGGNRGNKLKDDDVSPLAFMEAVKKSVCLYEDGAGYNFIQSVGIICRQKGTIEMERNERAAGRTPFSNLPDDKRFKIRKLSELITGKRDLMDYGDRNDRAKIEEAVRAASGKTFTDREFAEAWAFVEIGTGDPASLYTPIGDDEGSRLMDVVPDDKVPEAGAATVSEDACREILEEAVSTFELIKTAAGIQKRDVYKALFTKGILKSLKLETMHPATPYNKGRDPGVPSGNTELYLAMRPMGTVWYRDALYEKYVRRAVDGKPKTLDSLYAVYYNPLQEDFNTKFTDRQMAEMFGVSTAKISQDRTVYENKILPEMLKRIKNR